MVYLTLAAAIASEIVATTLMKYSDGFNRLWPSVGTVAGYLVAFALLAQVLKSMDVGSAYAIWSGAGTAVVALIGILFLGEAATAARLLGVALVVAGVVALNLGGAH
ncbi:DMT family transporter [Streptomyces hainanensis]|uniref:Multidrug efflux SMR transporter n=1 Tax=Streptomyces hainanensis TaxID=402648 RepID=A0A4R4TBU8_9ACTN|nr:multidrug efflux SMR transporter [Streptomyces hainanensis]TDC74717.1 multidrug efflux SMR transporter [Streptomyces hainanensis]